MTTVGCRKTSSKTPSRQSSPSKVVSSETTVIPRTAQEAALARFWRLRFVEQGRLCKSRDATEPSPSQRYPVRSVARAPWPLYEEHARELRKRHNQSYRRA